MKCKTLFLMPVFLMISSFVRAEDPLHFATVNASYWSVGNYNWVTPRFLFPFIPQWDGHPRPVEEITFSNQVDNNPDEDPRVEANRTRMIGEIEAALPVGEELDFLLFQDQSEWVAVSMVGTNGVQDHINKAIGWGMVAQGVSPGVARTVLHVTWAYPRPHTIYSSTFTNPAQMQAEVTDTYIKSVQAVNSNAAAAPAIRTHTGEAWAQKDWTNALYRQWGADHHSNVRGDILATLVTYAAVYNDDTSDIYSRNSDVSYGSFADTNKPLMKTGGNGTNDVLDLLAVINADLEPGEELLHPLTLDDWQELARIADRATFAAGDATLDGTVNSNDLSLLVVNWGKTSGAIWREGDFNADGAVNQADLDIYLAGAANPSADSDGDQIPDWWEGIHFGGITNAQTSLICSNGVNTVREAYLAGLDPHDSASRFALEGSADSFRWNGVSGRVYTVYWSSNLLSGFQILESNRPWTQNAFTGIIHSAESQGFYKVEVSPEL